jgi:hypothetical protein
MSNWEGLRNWARGYYTLAHDEPTWFSTVVSYDDGRSQMVLVSHFEYLDKDWVQLRSAICEENELSAKLALKKNAELGAIGGIGLLDGRYYLFHSVPLEDMNEDEFIIPMNAIAASADVLETSHSGGNDAF